MSIKPKDLPGTESEADAWLEQLTLGHGALEPFLAWRAKPENAAAFDHLASDRFPIWDAERKAIFSQLATMRCTQEEERDPLMSRMWVLERLILVTRGTALRAVQAKANVLHYLRWEQNDEETPAMEDIRTFVENCARVEETTST